MAQHLVSIYGTEKDRVNCPFYYKIGACRHGSRCSRTHNKPLFSQTILLENLYLSPDQIIASAAAQGLQPPVIPQQDLTNHFDDFYLDMYEEFSKHGTIDKIYVCENLADHLAGNTYVKFHTEEEAQSALSAIEGRHYAGRILKAEFSPVTDFREGKCRPFERDGKCEHGDYCHFMHLYRPSRSLLTDGHNDAPSSPTYNRRDHSDRYKRSDYRERSGRDSYYQDRHSSRDYDRHRSYRSERAPYDTDRRRDRRHSYERERSRDYYRRDRKRDRYDGYDDYSRSRKSFRDQR